eukprot:CAMPEP_0203778834 /NCGR_PEP_ID=MMETSP0099_2-20121227/8276_1 /ASSEMBLY_ACC=CAM_ASM_000209 /TAXON_ID=96639 /ORGANISM=" , Strain NY0313808BC1" /LENGTH=526 /DNA_ID=CAMNT_0050678505 /DNA_START=74 /DNA_END=1654 /DNA_ORIENTATION=+
MTAAFGNVTAAKLVDFNDAEIAFRNKSTPELVRNFLILKVCSFPIIVKNSEILLNTSYKVLGQKITNKLVKETFFAQFCGAEDEAGLKPVMRKLEDAGISGILDYAAEGDLEEEQTTERENQVAVRTYSYENEKVCEAATRVFEQCIRTARNVAEAGGNRELPFAAIKLTALGNPILLKRMSEMIVETRNLFQRMEDKLDRPTVGSLSLEEWRLAYRNYFVEPENPLEIDNMFFQALGKSKEEFEAPGAPEPRLDIVDWSRSMNMEIIAKLIQGCKKEGRLKSASLNEEELKLARNLFARLSKIAKLAGELDVSLMVDAEHCYFQPCIDANVLMLQREYNKDKATIYNTYQCYLKSTSERLDQDLERSKREGWVFAAKLVRGAYMVHERKLAKAQGIPSPIHETLQDTHDSYNGSLDIMLQDPQAHVMIASHNQETCEFATEKMAEYGISPSSTRVFFGQLLGMADQLTYILGANHYNAYKYLPYGKVEEVLPYLIRRAQENSGLMAGAVHERNLLKNEIKRRIGL